MPAQSAAIRAGKAFVELFADLTKLESGLKLAEKHVAKFGQSVESLGKKMMALGAGIAAPLAAAAKHFADAGSELNDMSARTGISVEALSTLGYAAKQSGADLSTVEIAVKKMQKALTAGSEENKAAGAAFQSLGLSVKNLMQLDPGAQFALIAKRIGEVRNPTARAGAALQIFGKSGTALLPMIRDLGALTEEAKKFGLVWTGEEAKKADALGDSLSLLGQIAGKSAAVIGGELAPMLTGLAKAIAQASKSIGGFLKTHGEMIQSTLLVGAGIAAAGAALVALGAIISKAAAAFGVLASGISFLLTPVNALILPIGALAAGLGVLTYWLIKSGNAGKILGWLGEQFNGLAATAQATMKGMSDALAAGDIQLAARVLWAGLKLEWQKGSAILAKLTDDWVLAIKQGFADVSTDVAAIWIRMISGLKSEWYKFVDAIGASARSTLGGALTKWTGGLVTGAQVGLVAAAPGAAEGEAEREGQNQLKILRENQEIQAKARAAAAAAARSAAEKDLGAAQKALDKVLEEAAKKKSAAAAEAKLPAAPGVEEPAMPAPEEVGAAIQKAKAKIDVAGGFQAAALRGLGAGASIQNEQLTEQKKTNDKLEKLNRQVAEKQAVFA